MAVLDEVIEPHLGHLAIDGLEVFLSDGYPLRFSRRTRGGSVEDGLTREEDVTLTILMAIHIRTEVLILVGVHILTITFI